MPNAARWGEDDKKHFSSLFSLFSTNKSEEPLPHLHAAAKPNTQISMYSLSVYLNCSFQTHIAQSQHWQVEKTVLGSSEVMWENIYSKHKQIQVRFKLMEM